MPRDYRVRCLICGYDEVRYRNIKKCPVCGSLLERVSAKCICFHGTDGKAAKSILGGGFKPDTWFARHLEDAVCYGGSHIFEVAFDTGGLPSNWQFHDLKPVGVDRIVAYHRFNKETVFNNEELREEVCKSNEVESDIEL